MVNTDVQEIYVAYYGRPADPGGEIYWREQIAQAGGNLDAVIDAFGASAEFTERFADLDTEALITGIYQRLFNREPDAGGAGILHRPAGERGEDAGVHCTGYPQRHHR